MAWDWLGSAVSDIGAKIWKIAKLAVPLFGILEGVRWLVNTFWKSTVDWAQNKIDTAMGSLAVDLALPVSPWIAKINSIIPLEEMWHYLLVYLGIASAAVGIKWCRNLIPGFS
jgi:hypothetical protein